MFLLTPLKETEYSNKRHRPIGIGVQGLADVFAILKYSFISEQSKQLNKDIFETIYYASLKASAEIAKEDGHYETYEGSPISKGILQFDMWDVKPSNRWDWDEVRKLIKKYGVRNSLLVAPMPTASTSQILGNNECFEPFTTNCYVRRTLSGEFIVFNKYLFNDLVKLGLWDDEMRIKIMRNNGSILNIDGIPTELKMLYKTVWELSQKEIVKMSIDRAPFICQSQSLNIHIAEPTFSMISSLHFYTWKGGLKTGMYYLRSKPAVNAIQFTLPSEKKQESCSIEEQDCLPCSG